MSRPCTAPPDGVGTVISVVSSSVKAFRQQNYHTIIRHVMATVSCLVVFSLAKDTLEEGRTEQLVCSAVSDWLVSLSAQQVKQLANYSHVKHRLTHQLFQSWYLNDTYIGRQQARSYLDLHHSSALKSVLQAG